MKNITKSTKLVKHIKYTKNIEGIFKYKLSQRQSLLTFSKK